MRNDDELVDAVRLELQIQIGVSKPLEMLLGHDVARLRRELAADLVCQLEGRAVRGVQVFSSPDHFIESIALLRRSDGQMLTKIAGPGLPILLGGGVYNSYTRIAAPEAESS